MQTHFTRRWAGAGSVLVSVATLSACGGGSPTGPLVPQLTITGTAAKGLALDKATVSAKCVGAVAQATTASDGSYSLKLMRAGLPCVLRASDGKGTVLHSVAQGNSQNVVAHITPLTDLLLTRATRLNASTAFDTFSEKLMAQLSSSALSQAQADVTTLLNGTVDASALPSFISGTLKAATPGQPSNDPHDQLLDKLALRSSADKTAAWVKQLSSPGALPTPAPFKPEIRLPVGTVTLPMGASVALAATVNYPADARQPKLPVVWSVVDTDGGRISADGSSASYIAPYRAGTYRVRATRDDYAKVSTELSVTVTNFAPSLSVSSNAITLMPGQSYQLEASANTQQGGTGSAPVTWKVVESGGGSITADGRYTAPSLPGLFHVQVARQDRPEKSISVDVRVTQARGLERYTQGLQALSAPMEPVVLRDAASWTAWRARQGLSSSLRPEDEVDFSKNMVVAVAGRETGACGRATVADVQAQASQWLASLKVTPAPTDAVCLAVTWQPLWLFQMPQSALPVRVVGL